MNESTPTWSRITARLVRGDELTHAEASWAMDEVMSGEATPVQLAGFLVALQAKGRKARMADSTLTGASRPQRRVSRPQSLVARPLAPWASAYRQPLLAPTGAFSCAWRVG